MATSKATKDALCPPICPRCLKPMDHIGSVGIVHPDGEWDAQADRYDCPDGHTILVLDTNRIDDVEGYERDLGHGQKWKL